MMPVVSYYLSAAALAAVFVVLCLGLWNMWRGRDPGLSQTLMRWRIGLQFLAVVMFMLFVFLTRHS